MLMRRNVAAGIGSTEQGEYCRAALQQSDHKEPRYKWPTLLFVRKQFSILIQHTVYMTKPNNRQHCHCLNNTQT